MNPTPEDIVDRYSRKAAERDGSVGNWWKRIAEYIQPQKGNILGNKTLSEGGWIDDIFDMTANHASDVLANGLVTHTTPATQRWCAFTAPAALRKRIGINVAVDKWYQEATEIVINEISGSNFYSRIHEVHLERNDFGTGALLTEDNAKTLINFMALSVNTYVICEDHKGNVDTVMREFKLTVRQAVQEFGEENLPQDLRNDWNSKDSKDREKSYTFIHSIEPNREYKGDSDDAKDRAILDLCVCKEHKEKFVRQSGYHEMPIAVSRFKTVSGEVWGWGPGMTVLPIVRQVNFLEMQADILAEKLANPPMLRPSNLLQRLDMRAGGENVYDKEFPDAIPRPMHEVGRYDVSKDRIADKRADIQNIYHNAVFNLFSSMDRDITAYEASQMAGEKLDQLAPMWQRLTTELLTPTLLRVFGICARAEIFPPAPQELMQDEGGKEVGLAVPEVAYLSRLSLAIQYHEIQSVDQLLARAQQLAAISPELAMEFLRPYNLDAMARMVGKNLGVPAALQRDEEEVQAERDAMAKQQQAMAAAQAAGPMAKAASDFSKASPDVKGQLLAMAGGG